MLQLQRGEVQTRAGKLAADLLGRLADDPLLPIVPAAAALLATLGAFGQAPELDHAFAHLPFPPHILAPPYSRFPFPLRPRCISAFSLLSRWRDWLLTMRARSNSGNCLAR